MSVLTADDILESIKRTFSVPTHQQLLTDLEILKFCDEELQNTIYPEIIVCRGDFFTALSTVSTVAGTYKYRVPSRATARGLRDIILRLSDGSERNLNDITIDQKHKYSSNQQGQPRFFYMMGDYVCLVPTPDSASYFLDLMYDVRPSKLVKVESTVKISAVNFTTNQVTLEAELVGFTTSTPVDFVSAGSANIPLAMSVVPSSVATTDVQFTSLPSELAAGDYVCFEKQSPFVSMPEECLPTLIQAAGNRVMQALGDLEALANGKEKLKDLVAKMKMLLAPRVRGEDFIPFNNHFIGNGYLTSKYRRG